MASPLVSIPTAAGDAVRVNPDHVAVIHNDGPKGCTVVLSTGASIAVPLSPAEVEALLWP